MLECLGSEPCRFVRAIPNSPRPLASDSLRWGPGAGQQQRPRPQSLRSRTVWNGHSSWSGNSRFGSPPTIVIEAMAEAFILHQKHGVPR